MSAANNTQTVQEIYANFGRGDIPAIIAALSDNVQWETPKAGENVPIGGKFHGHQEVVKFFTDLDQYMQVQIFEPREFIAQGDQVVTLGYYKFLVKSTSLFFEADWAMVWTFNNGKVSHFKEYSNTFALAVAFGK